MTLRLVVHPHRAGVVDGVVRVYDGTASPADDPRQPLGALWCPEPVIDALHTAARMQGWAWEDAR